MEKPTPEIQTETKPSASSEPEAETIQQRSSMEVSKNSRGYNWKVKVYDDDPEKAFDEMVKIEAKCMSKYGAI